MAKKSTIVPKLLRTGLSGLERLNPRASAYIAERLWFRVGTPPDATRRNRQVTDPGRPFTIDQNGHQILGRIWGEEGAPSAYLVHGWGGWWQQLSSFVPMLTDRGYRVIAFDALAHGDSGPGSLGGRSSTVPEMAEGYHAVADRWGTPALTIAHSMGCLSVMWAQRHHGITPERQVLIAAAASTSGMLDVFCGALGLSTPTRDRLVTRFARRMGRPLSDFDLLPLVAAEQQLSPALLVHDRDDPMTSARESAALAQQWPGSDLLLTEGHGHYRVLRAQEVLDRTMDFALARRH